jgi:hypothetical protein
MLRSIEAQAPREGVGDYRNLPTMIWTLSRGGKT